MIKKDRKSTDLPISFLFSTCRMFCIGRDVIVLTLDTLNKQKEITCNVDVLLKTLSAPDKGMILYS